MGHPANYASIDFLWLIITTRTQKRAAVAINSRKLARAHTGAIGFKGCQNSGRIRALSGVKG